MPKDPPIEPKAADKQPVRPSKPNPQYLAKLQDVYDGKEKLISYDYEKKG